MNYSLKRYRKLCKMSQQELANRVGCVRETIANMESGKYSPSLDIADRLSVVLSAELARQSWDECYVTVYDLFELRSHNVYESFVESERRRAGRASLDRLVRMAEDFGLDSDD